MDRIGSIAAFRPARLGIALTLLCLSCLLGAVSLSAGPRLRPRVQATAGQTAAQPSAANWQVIDSPNTTEQLLFAMNCVSDSDCWSGGYYMAGNGLRQTLIEHWNGKQWTIVPSPNMPNTGDNRLYAVACSTNSDCWAAGTYAGNANYNAPVFTLLLHWNGNDWAIVPSSDPSTTYNMLLAMTCTTSGQCWAVGRYISGSTGEYQTMIKHWDGTAWSLVASLNPSNTGTNSLGGVTCLSPSDCTAVGYFTDSSGVAAVMTQHWDGTSWSLIPAPSPSDTGDSFPAEITCTATNNCWMVGYYDTGAPDVNGVPLYQTFIERWNGTSWAVVSSPNTSPSEPNGLFGVSCASASECWAVGDAYDGTFDHPLLLSWNGNAWSIAAEPSTTVLASYFLNAVSCSPTRRCSAVGQDEDDYVAAAQWNGGDWAFVAPSNAVGGGYFNYLKDVACSSEVDCWAVGERYGPTLIQHWDGKSWSIFHVPPGGHGEYLSGVTCVTANDCWTVGSFLANERSHPLIRHWDGTAWTIVPDGPDDDRISLDKVSCTSTSDCWAVGWTRRPPDYEALIEHWDGLSWSIVPAATGWTSVAHLQDVTCVSAADCWAVGYATDFPSGTERRQTLIQHWDGHSWSVTPSPNVTDQTFLNSVACASPSLCWSVGYAYDSNTVPAVIEKWDGSSWSLVASSWSGSLTDVTCTSNTSCWAVGTVGNPGVLYWDGATWSAFPAPARVPEHRNEVVAITCVPGAICFAVGDYDATNFSIDHQGSLNTTDPIIPQTLVEQFSANLEITSAFRTSDGLFHLRGNTVPNASVDIQSAPDFKSPFTTSTTVTADSTGAFHYDDDVFNVSRRAYRAAAHY